MPKSYIAIAMSIAAVAYDVNVSRLHRARFKELEEANSILAQALTSTERVADYYAHKLDENGIAADEFDRIAIYNM